MTAKAGEIDPDSSGSLDDIFQGHVKARTVRASNGNVTLSDGGREGLVARTVAAGMASVVDRLAALEARSTAQEEKHEKERKAHEKELKAQKKMTAKREKEMRLSAASRRKQSRSSGRS